MTVNEFVLLTLLDVLMIVGIAASLVAIPALLISREFRIASKTALGVLCFTAVNVALHAAVSLLRL